MKIAVIPIDNRPVCYNLLKDIASIDENIELFLPPRKMLGDLTKIADIDGIYNWLKNLSKVDKIIVALDTIAYGGLIPSRRSTDSFNEITSRLAKFKQTFLGKEVYAFSSIMRISNNNINVEEKDYWDKWGKKIFDYSYHTHKNGLESCITNLIPTDILDDYMKTREKNFEINKNYLTWNFKTLIFSKDDCAEYGFNVQEAKMLEQLGGKTKTGADEIPLTLFAKAINGEMKIRTEFTEPKFENLISNYEDISIKNSVLGQIELSGSKEVKTGEDIILVVNNFIEKQGEIVMKIATKPFDKTFTPPQNRYMIADVRFANGADNEFIKQIKTIPPFGFSAWNTSANTLGTLLCMSKVKFFAKKYNDLAFKKLLAIRFLDDWAYQSNVRQLINSPTDISNLMKPYENKIKKLLNINFNATYSFPWNRIFEVEVKIELS